MERLVQVLSFHPLSGLQLRLAHACGKQRLVFCFFRILIGFLSLLERIGFLVGEPGSAQGLGILGHVQPLLLCHVGHEFFQTWGRPAPPP